MHNSLQSTRNLVLLSLLVAFAIVLRSVEGLIPNPLPWVRIGFANIMTLLAILLFGLKAGLLLTSLRILIASVFFGTFLSPTFFLSLSAGFASTIVMGVSSRYGKHILSPFGLSALGGFTHNVVQLSVAYVLIVRHTQIFYLFPILATVGILTGCLNGWVVLALYQHLTRQFPHLAAAPGPGT
jgi:heptaprenyl diphosphate synthase